ncbi:MAG: N-acetylglucosamine kinase [Planctomycetota bacterium JB042]
MTDVVLGVDGGGTRTRVAIAERSGRVLGVGESGPGNWHDVGVEAVAVHLERARDAAWAAAGAPPRPAVAAYLGMASVGDERDREAIRDAAARAALAPADAVGVGQDLRVALAGGLSLRPGVALIAGTGSSVYGRTADGREWQAGGFGSFLDDGGSAFDLGRRAMIAAVRARDGRGRETALSARLLAHVGGGTLRDLLRRLDAVRMARAEVAACAPLVTAAAAEGDAVAIEILEAAVEELALAVETVVARLGLAAPEVAATGGLAGSGPPYRDALDRAIVRRVADARVVDPELPPVVGAALLALERAGVPVDAAVLAAAAESSAR